jgi:hypothetical protein
MVALADIVPQTRTVQLAAGELELHGLGLRQIADLFVAFPVLRNLFTEGAPEIDAVQLMALAPEAIGTIIAGAAGQPEAAAHLANGSGLAPDEILDCLLVIRDLTFPRGVAPLWARLTALIGGGAAGPSGKAADMSMPQQPSNSLLQDTSLVQ